MTRTNKGNVVIVGAGPAGLAVAYELVQKKYPGNKIILIEEDKQVGGLSKTLRFKGFRFDLGGHRFYTKIPEINKFYKQFLGKDMLIRKRLSRIYYMNKFFNYPLSFTNALRNLGIFKSVKIVLSYLIAQINKYKEEKNFDQWMINRFGKELFKMFFKSYTQKVWGIPTSKLSADWAAQRIQDFNLFKAVINAIFKINTGSKTIIDKFHYPKHGPGMLYESMEKKLKRKGVRFLFNTKVTGINRSKNKILSLKTQDTKGREKFIKGDSFVSTMPFDKLILYLNPPHSLKKIVNALKFRTFMTVGLIVKSNPFPDQWIYIHEPLVKVGRIQNFRNWSPFMIKKGSKNTPIGMEYFASDNDKLWNTSDSKLLDLAKKEISQTSLVKPEDIVDGFVYRIKNAYPVYNFDYQRPLQMSKRYISKFENLYLCGRGGLFRYNNQDHSILSGFYTARNIVNNNRDLDVWSINEEKDGKGYLESK